MTDRRIIELLDRINILCRDNGKCFTKTDRLEVISELMTEAGYSCLYSGKLCRLYSRVPAESLRNGTVLISTHVDCEEGISRCFTEELEGGLLKGTFDNALTNTLAIAAALEQSLPEAAVLAFTGDEECDSGGADEVCGYLARLGIRPVVIVLDVTDMGWESGCSYTIENDFWSAHTERTVLREALGCEYSWRFVPEDVDEIPALLPRERLIREEAEADESWEYDERDIDCFSLCIPVYGEMHSDVGVLARVASMQAYMDMLGRIARGLTDRG